MFLSEDDFLLQHIFLFLCEHSHWHNFFLSLAIFLILCSFVRCGRSLRLWAVSHFRSLSSSSTHVANKSLFFSAGCVRGESNPRQTWQHYFITPHKILCQAWCQNPKLFTRALHHVLDTFSAYKEPQKHSCQA